MKRVLVTGGSGFIGSFLCEKLINEGHEVIAIDNFFTGKKRNLKQIINKPNFKLIHQDVEEPIKLEIEWIFNLACPASPIHYQSNPIKTSKTNVAKEYAEARTDNRANTVIKTQTKNQI